MRFIVWLFLLIRLAEGAQSASVTFGPPPRTTVLAPSDFPPFDTQTTTLFAALEPTSSDKAVSVGQPPGAPPVKIAGLNLSETPHLITQTEIEAAVLAAFGESKPQLRLEVLTHTREVLAAGNAVFPLPAFFRPMLLRPDTAVLWRGYWRTLDGRRLPIWARIRAVYPRSIVRLRADVTGGSALDPSLIEQVSVLDSALRTDPPELLEQYEGKVLRHFAKAGTVISRKDVEDPPLVRRNTMVRLEVISGNLRLRLKARAEADGRVGDSIRLVIPAGRRQFLATLQPDGSAILNVAVESGGEAALAGRGVANEL
jgi:flagella basal body P-ring formation protein FlgA